MINGKVAIGRDRSTTPFNSQHRSIDSVLSVCLAVAALGVGGWFTGKALAGEPLRSGFERIKVVGDEPRNGFFDVSIEYGDDGIGWLAYSMVDAPEHVETHLAKSTDRGKTWKYVKALNHSSADSVVVDAQTRKGVWRYETPTLLFDPKDAPARRWKLFVHRYFTVPPYKKDDRRFDKGWIEYKYAATPDGNWSEGANLFGKQETGSRVDLTVLHPDLRDFRNFTELGSLVEGGTMYLSMDASVSPSGLGKWKQRRIVLVSSGDHGVTWNYVGSLTDYRDASALGYVILTGSSLVRENGRIFLLVSPAGAKGFFKKNRGHDGTLVVEFDDIRKARLKRDERGRLVVSKTYRPDLSSGGLSDYDEQNTGGGMLFSQIDIHAMPEVFQIFSTMRRIAQ